jgi:hypothetical protein
MRIKMRFNTAFATVIFLCLLFVTPTAGATAIAQPAASADGIIVQEIVTENGDQYVRYPQLAGLADPAIQQAVNDDIVNSAKIAQRLITLSTLQQDGATLEVSQTSYLSGNLLSVAVSAKGTMENRRSGHEVTALSYDLTTGLRLSLDDFFTDPAAAVAWMEEQLLSGYVDELSGYLEYAEVTPLPTENFSFDADGITFYYSDRQFAFLSGYCGEAQFQYGELQEFLLNADGSIPARLGIVQPQYTDVQILDAITSAVADGMLPGLPVRLLDPLPDLVLAYRLVRTPDQYPGGRYYQMEDPRFRQILILSDSLLAGYEQSVTEGILAMRMNLFGIRTGVTQRSRWLAILGEPDPSVAFDEYTAADYGLPVGIADYYTISGRQLMLYADSNDVLYAVRLTK